MSAQRSPIPYTRRWGDGPTVLFLHGLTGSSRYSKSVADAGSGFRGVVVDLIGFGRSAKPRDFGYDVEAHAAAIRAVCPNPDVIVGHSIGAVIAAAYGRAHAPSASILLIGAPLYRSASDARTHLREVSWLAGATVDATRTARCLCGAMCALRPVAMLGARLLRGSVPAAVASDSVRHTWSSYSGTVEHVLLRHRSEADIEAATSAIVALHGSDDRVAPVARVQELAAGSTKVEICCIAGGVHHLPLSHPDQVSAAIVDLLASPAGR